MRRNTIKIALIITIDDNCDLDDDNGDNDDDDDIETFKNMTRVWFLYFFSQFSYGYNKW